MTTYTVNTLVDENDGINVGRISLRDAINAANANPGPDSILFDSIFDNATIGLSNGHLQIDGDLTISGNGTSISGRGQSRVFYTRSGNITIEGVAIVDGFQGARNSGGGIYNTANLTLKNVTVANNRIQDYYDAYVLGGGIYSNGIINIINSTVTNNHAYGPGWSARGGGLWTSGTANIINSTFSGNSAANWGGGYGNNGTATIVNSTFSGNSSGGDAGAIGNSRTLRIYNSTITQNSGGHAVYAAGSLTEIGNTIIAGNAGNFDISSGSVFSIGGNLIGGGDGVGAFNQPNDQTGVTDPKLGPLANNGGATLTHKPNSDSPAVNAGFNAIIPQDIFDINGNGNTGENLPLDQTGNLRVVGGTIDVGAVETTGDGPVLPLISIADANVREGNSGRTILRFPITLNRTFNEPVTIRYSTTNGTAVAPQDFTAVDNGTLTISPGTTSGNINIDVVGDTNPEADETFSVRLTEVTNGNFTRAVATGTIINEDFVTVSLGPNLSVREGNSGATRVQVPITLSRTSGIPVRVDLSTSNGSARDSGDYIAVNKTITFQPGQTSVIENISVRGDAVFEPNENFSVNLSNPVGGTLGTTRRITVNITNDDSQPRIFIDNSSMREANSGVRNMVFSIQLSNPTSQAVTADFLVQNGSARAPEDYNATSGRISIAPGNTRASINVGVRGDTVFEPNETFNVVLSNIRNASAGTTRATGTIVNDDTSTSKNIDFLSLGKSDNIIASSKAFDYADVFAVDTGV